MRLFDEFLGLCLVNSSNMAIKPDGKLKSWQRISRAIRVVCGVFVDLTECDMSRYLDIIELFVLLVGHKTNRTGETCRVAGSKQLLGIRCIGFAWSTHFTIHSNRASECHRNFQRVRPFHQSRLQRLYIEVGMP
jgi:hypothetical protein